MSGGVSVLALASAERRLLGPDLAELGEWPLYVEILDAARDGGDFEEYASVWLAISDLHGGGASVLWMNDDDADHPGRAMSGFHTDQLADERRRRWEALADHHEGVEGFDDEIRRQLVRLGRFADNRKTSLLGIKAVIRAFLATGGRLLIAPESARNPREPVEVSPDANRFAKGDWSEADAVSTRAMFRLARRWRAQPKIERLVRSLGTPTGNGWIVLEGSKS